jgi:(p)ppGpp synthase/HD superfamily hydrolase
MVEINVRLLGEAAALAASIHREQTDKGGKAYFWHPFRVAQSLERDGLGLIHQIAALLHDTVEDHPLDITLETIEAAFGPLVREVVDRLTRRGHYEARTGGQPAEWVWDETYKDYIRRCCENPIARVVKLHDVYDNGDPRRHVDGVPVGRNVWTIEYIRSLAV